MPTLRELQTEFCHALLAGEEARLARLIENDGLPVAARLDIYRNNVFVSLKQVLLDCYPVVCRLVDERFFLYAAHEFIRRHPPVEACLAAYGEHFADFLATFPPCRELVYLPDVARLEWLMHRAAHADAATPLAPASLAAIAAADLPALVLAFDPSLGFLHSAWPIDRIWRANQPGADPEARIDLDAGGVWIEVRRRGEDVVFRGLDAATYALRAALAAGQPLGAATEAALVVDPSFGLVAAFGELFSDGSVQGLTVGPNSGRAGR
jgi:hypothetical protein